MGLIKKSVELVIPTTVKMMVYGQAGMGKTTFALSAPKPLLLDFDGGVKRVNLAHLSKAGIVQITSWAEVQQLMQEDLSEFQTIVVDTIGKMIDFIIKHCCGGRQPSIKDWGAINADFKWFTDTIGGLNKNIVFIAHRDTRKDGDDTVFVPALREKNYNNIVTELDLLGYMEMKNVNGVQQRSITFDPTMKNDGKNTCQLPGVMYIQNIINAQGQATAANDFIEKKILAPYAGMVQKKQDVKNLYAKNLQLITDGVAFITDAETANQFLAHVKEYDVPGSSILEQARAMFGAKVKELGLVWNAEAKKYVDKA